MKPSTAEIQVKDLNHYGIIAGIIDEIGLVEKIDELVGTHDRQKVTPGLAVKAMIINGLGMYSAPLYLFEKFFEGKATEHLLGEGVLPEHLNDDCWGRVLEKLFAQGLTKIFVTVALNAAKKMGVKSNSLHLDSSSFHVDGKYIQADESEETEIAALASNSAVLQEYKAQQSTERGFRFLKDPLFFTSSIFLKSPHRVAALAMVMGLCLLVYNLGQRSLRLALQAADQTILNQLGKPPTSTPALRWVFQCFMSIHLITFAGVKQITNLTSERSHILRFLSSSCRQYYLLS